MECVADRSPSWVDSLAKIERAGSSASRAGSSVVYASDVMKFSDVDGDGMEEFIVVEYTESYPKQSIATVSRWLLDGTRVVEQASQPLRGDRLLVGNIDHDPLDEVVLFGRDVLLILDWQGAGYQLFESDACAGGGRPWARVGALLDIDGDGRKEIVLGTVDPRGDDGADPTTLVFCRFDSGIDVLFEWPLANGIQTLAGGDLTDNGRDEIVTEEASSDGTVVGQLTIYQVDADAGVEQIYKRNRGVDRANFLGVVEVGGVPLLVVDGIGAWPSISLARLQHSSAGFDLIPQRLDRFERTWAAIRSTMAYSAERRAYVRFNDRRAPDVIRVDEELRPAEMLGHEDLRADRLTRP